MKYLKWRDIANSENSYDVIFLGSSRGYCAYNPLILDDLLSVNSYNMCTGSQNIIETYYILKEILKTQEPRTVIYELFLPSFSKSNDFHPILSNARFMTPTGKIDMIVNGFGAEGIYNFLLPIPKMKNYIRRDLLSVIFNRKRRNIPEQPYTWIKGYRYDNTTVASDTVKTYGEIVSFKNTSVSKKKLEYYFLKLIELCDQNNIKLICVRSAYPPSRLKSSPIDSANKHFSMICSINNVPFYDFNYVPSEKYKYLDTDFSDYHHMNSRGANKITRHLSDILSNFRVKN